MLSVPTTAPTIASGQPALGAAPTAVVAAINTIVSPTASAVLRSNSFITNSVTSIPRISSTQIDAA